MSGNAGGDTHVAILVSSCASYYRIVVPVVLDSLARAGVSMRDVHVVVGETPGPERRDTFEGANAWFVPYVNFDNNALVWAVSGPGRAALAGREWVVCVHDTVEVVPHTFADRVRATLRDVPAHVHAFKIKPGLSMSMGYYRLATLWARADDMLAAVRVNDVATTPEDRRYVIKFGGGAEGEDEPGTEDVVFGWLERTYGAESVRALNPMHGASIEASRSVYGGGTQRITETWPDPGIVKRKANWGQGGMHVTP